MVSSECTLDGQELGGVMFQWSVSSALSGNSNETSKLHFLML